jgi:hypothetical protein
MFIWSRVYFLYSLTGQAGFKFTKACMDSNMVRDIQVLFMPGRVNELVGEAGRFSATGGDVAVTLII